MLTAVVRQWALNEIGSFGYGVTKHAAVGLADERFIITTHEGTLSKFQAKAADYERYMEGMTELRARAVAAFMAKDG